MENLDVYAKDIKLVREDGEIDEVFAERILSAIDNMDDNQWEKLSSDTKIWFNEFSEPESKPKVEEKEVETEITEKTTDSTEKEVQATPKKSDDKVESGFGHRESSKGFIIDVIIQGLIDTETKPATITLESIIVGNPKLTAAKIKSHVRHLRNKHDVDCVIKKDVLTVN